MLEQSEAKSRVEEELKKYRGHLEKLTGIPAAALALDVTGRRRAESALHEKIEGLSRLATVVSDSNDAVIMHDLNGKILAWNRGAKETYGYTEAEALGKNVRGIVAEPDREAVLSLIQRVKQGEIVKSFELRRIAKDGRILDVWLTTTLLSDEEGKAVAIATTERDITERKRAEESLRESEQMLAKTFASLREAVFIVDADTANIRDCNPAASEIFGYSRDELVGRTTDFLHVDQQGLAEFRQHLFLATAEMGFLSLPGFRMKRKGWAGLPQRAHGDVTRRRRGQAVRLGKRVARRH